MPKPKTVTVYLRVCKKAVNPVRFVSLDYQDINLNTTMKCCRIIPYKLKVPKERK